MTGNFDRVLQALSIDVTTSARKSNCAARGCVMHCSSLLSLSVSVSLSLSVCLSVCLSLSLSLSVYIMYHTISAILPSTYQHLLKLVATDEVLTKTKSIDQFICQQIQQYAK